MVTPDAARRRRRCLMPLPLDFPAANFASLLLLAALAALCVVGVGVTVSLVNRSRQRPLQPQRALVAGSPLVGSFDAPPLSAASAPEAPWLRRVADIGATIDLDEVLSRTLALAGDVPGVDAALVAIDGPDGEQLVAASGMSAEEVGELDTPALPRLGGATAVGISYRYPSGPEHADPSLLREGVVLPLTLERSRVGSIAVFSRTADGHLSEAATRAMADVAEFAAFAIQNAQTHRKAHEFAMLDAQTGLYNNRFFYEMLEREVARAARYHRPLSLLLCRGADPTMSEPPEQNALGHDAADVAHAIRHVVRTPDVPCRIGDEGFGIILPESVIGDAERLFQRLEHAVALRRSSEGSRQISGGVAELATSETPKTFYDRARDAFDRAVRAGVGRLEVARERTLPPPQVQAGGE